MVAGGYATTKNIWLKQQKKKKVLFEIVLEGLKHWSKFAEL